MVGVAGLGARVRFVEVTTMTPCLTAGESGFVSTVMLLGIRL